MIDAKGSSDLEQHPPNDPSAHGRRGPLARLALEVLTTFVALATGNYLFHQWALEGFFDARLVGITLPVAELGPGWPALVYMLSAVATVGPASVAPDRARRRRHAPVAGAFVGLLTFGTWNVINLGWIPGWPWAIVVVDTTWHVVLGALAGGLLILAFPSVQRGGE